MRVVRPRGRGRDHFDAHAAPSHPASALMQVLGGSRQLEVAVGNYQFLYPSELRVIYAREYGLQRSSDVRDCVCGQTFNIKPSDVVTFVRFSILRLTRPVCSLEE
jgi:hypothetical protein